MDERFFEYFKKSNLTLLDIQRAGCVVFHMPEHLDEETCALFTQKLKDWAKNIRINVLILPHDIKVSAIPKEVLIPSTIHHRVDSLERQLKAVLSNTDMEELSQGNIVPAPNITLKEHK